MINFNRQSYLDLSILDALSVGAHIVTVATGGHRDFVGIGSEGMITVEQPSVDNLVKVMLSKNVASGKGRIPSIENIVFYQKFYTDEIYRKDLDVLISKLLGIGE